MPKVAWGLGADEIEQVQSTGFTPYEGPLVPRGVYTFAIKAKIAKSKNDNPMIKVLLILDGEASSEKDETKKQYDGAPIWDNVVVMDKTAWKVKQFCEGLGVSSSDFANRTIKNDDDEIVKIGNVKLENARVKVMTNVGKDQNGQPRPEVQQYLPADGDAKAVSDDEPEPDDDEPVAEGDDAADEPMDAEEETSVGEKSDAAPTEEQLMAMTNDDLKAYAKECGVSIAGKNKKTVVGDILALFSEGSDQGSEEDPF